MGLIEKIGLDLSWYNTRNGLPYPVKGGFVKVMLRAIREAITNEAFHAVLLFRFASFFYTKKMKLFSLYYVYRLKRRYGSTMAYTANIGGGLRLPHPYGLVIGGHVKIGIMTSIGQHVTLGGNFGRSKNNRTVPELGSWVFICAGAVVAGPVVVGDDVIVGANAVVSRNVPPHAITGGNPSEVYKYKDNEPREGGDQILNNCYYGYPLDYVNSLADGNR